MFPWLGVCMSVCVSTCLCVTVAVYLYMYVCVCVYMSVCHCCCVPLYVSVCVSTCLCALLLSISICLCVCARRSWSRLRWSGCWPVSGTTTGTRGKAVVSSTSKPVTWKRSRRLSSGNFRKCRENSRSAAAAVAAVSPHHEASKRQFYLSVSYLGKPER